jgi:hypothetical protein
MMLTEGDVSFPVRNVPTVSNPSLKIRNSLSGNVMLCDSLRFSADTDSICFCR